MQRRPPPRRRPSRIPMLRGSVGDLHLAAAQGDLAQSHDSGISRSVSLASLLTMAVPSATSTLITNRRAVSRPDVLEDDDEEGSIASVLVRRDDELEEARCIISVIRAENERLKNELVVKQLEIDRLKIETGASSCRKPQPPPTPVETIEDLRMVLKPIYAARWVMKKEQVESDPEEFELDDSAMEFWRGTEKKTGADFKVEVGANNSEFYQSSPRKSMSSSRSENWTLDKAHSLLRTSCSSSISMENLNPFQQPEIPSRPRQRSSIGTRLPKPCDGIRQQTEWKPCQNRPRPNKLDISLVTENAGMVRRLESPAAISLLSPRPFNRQNSVPSSLDTVGQQPVVPLLNLSNLTSTSSSNNEAKPTWSVCRQQKNHRLLHEAQNNAVESRQLLKNLQNHLFKK